MKILYVCQYFYPENFRGNDIVFDFVKKGYDVTVLTGKPNYPQGKFYKGYSFFGKREEWIKGAKVIRTPIYPRKNGKGIHLVLNYLSFVFFSYYAVLFRIKEKYDAIFIQQLSPVTMALPGLWVKRRQNIPVFLWVLDLWPESILANTTIKKGTIINLLEKLVKNIYNKSDIILISSSYFRELILNKCINKNKEIVYFPNWAEDVFENNQEIDIELPEFPEGFNIMFAGNVGESHGFETVLNAAENTINKGINWIIVGTGRKVDWIKKEIAVRNLKNVYLMGRYPLETMPHFFKKADVMLISLKDDPAFELTVPAKFQAYIASKKIVLGSLNGECNDLINRSKCGIAVPAGNSKLLTEKSIEMSKMSKEEKQVMSENSYSYYVNQFKKDNLLSDLDNLVKRVVKG